MVLVSAGWLAECLSSSRGTLQVSIRERDRREAPEQESTVGIGHDGTGWQTQHQRTHTTPDTPFTKVAKCHANNTLAE